MGWSLPYIYGLSNIIWTKLSNERYFILFPAINIERHVQNMSSQLLMSQFVALFTVINESTAFEETQKVWTLLRNFVYTQRWRYSNLFYSFIRLPSPSMTENTLSTRRKQPHGRLQYTSQIIIIYSLLECRSIINVQEGFWLLYIKQYQVNK